MNSREPDGKPDVEHIVTMGDSLTDKGAFYERQVLGVIPISFFTDLRANSPLGMFTNGNVWDNDFAAMLASTLIIESLRHNQDRSPVSHIPKQLSDSDLVDDIIVADPVIQARITQAYDLKDANVVRYKHKDFLRCYAEGGLTAHDYSQDFSVWKFFSKENDARKIVSTLNAKRTKLLADDVANNISPQEKIKSLVIEWSVANDFVTVNSRPTNAIADAAIDARMNNIRILYENGYRHFVLINLPDMSLTPKFQRLSKDEQLNAHNCVEYFNNKLSEACLALGKEFPEAKVDLFDVNSIFMEIYNNPEKFGFDRDKLSQPLIESPEFSNKNGKSHSNRHLFWDAFHPSATAHAWFAVKFYELFCNTYNFKSPANAIVSTAQAMYEQFMPAYKAKLKEDKKRYLGDWYHSVLLKELEGKSVDENADFMPIIKIILDHALKYDNRSKGVMIKLGWLDGDGNILNPLLADIKAESDFNFEIVSPVRPR